jgi:hypothetical protein
MDMIDIEPSMVEDAQGNLVPGHPSGGRFSATNRRVEIGSGLDPATGLHEIAGHAGLSELKKTGELGYELEGPLGRRLAAALPGTFSNQQFATDEEVKESLGLQSGQPFPDTGYFDEDTGQPIPFQRSVGFEEEAPTAADWFDVMQRENWVFDPVLNEWVNKGMPRRAHTTQPHLDPQTGQVVGRTQTGDAYMGQNPFTDEHGAVDALVSTFGQGTSIDPDTGEVVENALTGQGYSAERRLSFYEGRPHEIVKDLNGWKWDIIMGVRKGGYITGGGWFDETWDDDAIQKYATEASIRMAPERALFSGNLSEEMIRSIEKQVGESEAQEKRLGYYKRDLGL